MSAEQSREEAPSQRERDLSTKLEEAELAIQANSRRELKLLAELLKAKTTLLDESQQREHRLSTQLEQNTAGLDASQKREKQALTTRAFGLGTTDYRNRTRTIIITSSQHPNGHHSHHPLRAFDSTIRHEIASLFLTSAAERISKGRKSMWHRGSEHRHTRRPRSAQ